MRRSTKILLMFAFAAALLLAGCQRGDFKVSMVVEGQLAPHSGYNIGPDMYVEQGDPVPMTGAVIYIKGLEPDEFFKKNPALLKEK